MLKGKRKWWQILCPLLLPLFLSLFSGYRKGALPPDVLWDITPLGLLTGIRPDFFTYGTSCDFEGVFSFSLDYLRVFFKTVILELPFYYLSLRRLSNREPLFWAVWGNVLTHPFIFFFLQCLVSRFLVFLFGAEAIAICLETLLVGGYLRTQKVPAGAALWIALGNLFSWQVGPFIPG